MILAINIGSTTIKLALDKSDGEVLSTTLALGLDDNRELYNQKGFNLLVERLKIQIHKFLTQNDAGLEKLDLIISRGGLQKPGAAGIFRVNEAMCRDLSAGSYGHHPSSLGPVLAFSMAREGQISAYAIDPPSTDEFAPVARFSGIPEIQRRSAFHALSHKAAGRMAAAILGRTYKECNFIVAHLGGGITIGAHFKGQVIDCTNGLSEGPFTPERAGTLPLLEACSLFSDRHLEIDEIKQWLVGKGGLMAYLGTKNGLEVEEKIKHGDQPTAATFEAMIYQIAKDIGAMATVLKGTCDAVVLTGALTKSQRLLDMLEPRIAFLGRILVFPEDEEMQALFESAGDIINNRRPIIEYQ
ncbi:MAG: butyrate kinase [Pseudomonadota bacterium]|nr:butyrate kinase [Pseudomonadota bacterium]